MEGNILFILGVRHTQTTARFSSCPFTMEARVMRRLGHEVVYLGVEGADVGCGEQVAVVPVELYERTFPHSCLVSAFSAFSAF